MQSYTDAVEANLFDLGKTTPFFSGADQAIISSWQRRELPLYVVLKGLRQRMHVYNRVRKQEDPTFPSGVDFFAKGVDTQYDQLQKRLIGAHEDGAVSAPAPRRSQKGKKRSGPASSTELTSRFNEKLIELREGQADEAVIAFIDELLREGAGDAAHTDIFTAATALNELICERATAGLPEETRLLEEREARTRLFAMFPGMSPRAYNLKRAHERKRALMRDHGVRFVDLGELSA